MNRYILRRIVQSIPVFFAITLLSYTLILAAPGDPITFLMINPNMSPEIAESMRREMGLTDPPLVQYLYWLVGNDWTRIDRDGDGVDDAYGTRRGILRGDFGESLQNREPVFDLIMSRIPATLTLTIPALILGYGLGITLGLLAAVNRKGWFDQFVRFISTIGNAIPSFWFGLLLIIIFSVQLELLPMSGMRDITKRNTFDLWDRVSHMIMPVLVLSLGTIASISRFIRAEVLEVQEQDFIRTAHAKGLNNNAIWWRHTIRNALIPVATFLGPALSGLLGGAVIIESVFSWPGMGRLVVNAAVQRDYPLVMGAVVMGAVLYIIGLIISDVLYAWFDPRIRFD
ncbi:MAG: oligopeptide ABC transporter permease AppB [Anaerolineae bacterium]